LSLYDLAQKEVVALVRRLLDDVYEREAWNDTDEIRVVLFVDFEHPLPTR